MLRKETVSKTLLEVLHKLMELNTLENHRLVGGTALALQIGHRISVDIDLFSDKKSDYEAIIYQISEKFGDNLQKGRYLNGFLGNGITLFLHGIKIDILDWNTTFIRKSIVIENIRMASKEDIIPMKFNTFLCAPEYARYEKKDYIDIALLMKEYSLEKMMELYTEKYPNELLYDRVMIEGLLLYELAEKKIMPTMLNNFSWNDVIYQIKTSISAYNQKRI